MRQRLLVELNKRSFDVLVIGGGATGAGIALDAAQRGYEVALIEAQDFASGASSCSTKLLHGGVRYLEKALIHLQWEQLRFVRESLREREILFTIAPYLTRAIPIMLPFYHQVDRFYYPFGFAVYNWFAPSNSLPPNQILTKEEALIKAPFLKKEGLRGGVVYYDGQFDDARYNITLIKSAMHEGAIALNYVELTSFIKEAGCIVGVEALDLLTGQKMKINSSIVVNATGSGGDFIRQLDDSDSEPILHPSVGTHIVVDQSIQLGETGVLIPKTTDGRVLFILPWKGKTLVGTTDRPPSSLSFKKLLEEDINYLLEHLNSLTTTPLTKENVCAAWCGVRPLYQKHSPNLPSFEISRDHFIEKASSGLYTIAGGKWTTYRLMAEDLVDRLILDRKLPYKNPCRTASSFLVGAQKTNTISPTELSQKYSLDQDIAEHLFRSYGDQMEKVAMIARQGLHRCLHPHYPYIEAEVLYALREEYVQKISDFIMRRCTIGFLDHHSTLECIPRIGEIFAHEFHWTKEEYQKQCTETVENFKTIW